MSNNKLHTSICCLLIQYIINSNTFILLTKLTRGKAYYSRIRSEMFYIKCNNTAINVQTDAIKLNPPYDPVFLD